MAEVFEAVLIEGGSVVVKIDRSQEPTPLTESFMLRYLGAHTRLPVPRVLWCDERVLVLEKLPGSTGCTPAAEPHAAELIWGLHEVTGGRFGFERDTLIGPLPQPCPWSDSWAAFFAEHRLLHMARLARDAGRLPRVLMEPLDRVAGRMDRLLEEPDCPRLVHGDIWSGNVLSDGPRITGLLDPAIYFAHPEVELAYMTLFGGFGRGFFDAYARRRPIAPGFFEERRHVYNLYPLLVHVRLFGGGYVESVRQNLRHLGMV